MTRLIRALVATLGVAAFAASVTANQQTATDPNYTEGRRLFEQLDYENAVKALDQAIVTLEGTQAADPAARALLASTYELRARSKFGLGDTDGAQADFISLLRLNPASTLTGEVSPRVVALFDATVQANVANVNLTVVPPTARLSLDGAPTTAGPLRIMAGEHQIAAEQAGYRRLEQAFTAVAGAPADVALELVRVSAVLNIMTAPAGVDVTLDGNGVGRTAPGPPSSDYSEAIAAAKVTGEVSSVLTVVDVMAGAHVLEFARECHIRVRRNVAIDELGDFTIGPVPLLPAIATLSVTANAPEVRVLVDGKPRGTAPFTMFDLCEGEHSVDLRSSVGRFSSRVDAKAGSMIPVAGILTPAFALLPSTSQASSVSTDALTAVERALEPLQSVKVFAPTPAQSKTALEAVKPPADWLAPNGTSFISTGAARTQRAELSAKLAEDLEAQGVALLSTLPDSRTMLLLLAAGNSDPDVLELRVGSPDSVKEAIDRLTRTASLFRPSLGVSVVDVADVAGAIVAGVGRDGSDIRVGDLITAAGGKPVANATALEAVVAERKPGEPLSLDITAPDGTSRSVDAPVVLAPRVISQFDPAVLADRSLIDLRARLVGSTDPLEQSVIRLNTGVALMRAGRWSDAQGELRQVKLPDGPGVGDGTVQYLSGIAALNLGDRAGAEAAFKRAQGSAAQLTEDGPPVSELAETMIAEIQAGR